MAAVLTAPGQRDEPQPDDFMIVTIGLAFQAKENPGNSEPHPVDFTIDTVTYLPAEEDTADLLEQIAKAIRERRLFGFAAQWCAELPVATGEWVSSEHTGDPNRS
jgi:hypothetical protein